MSSILLGVALAGLAASEVVLGVAFTGLAASEVLPIVTGLALVIPLVFLGYALTDALYVLPRWVSALTRRLASGDLNGAWEEVARTAANPVRIVGPYS